MEKHPLKSLKGKSYVFTKVRHKARQDLTTSAEGGDYYANIFSCIPYEIPFRPPGSVNKTLKNGGGNFNEIRFEDLKGSEKFFTH